MNFAAEHHLIDLGSDYNIALHGNAKEQTNECANQRKQHGFAIDIRVHLMRREAKHLQRGNFSHTLGDVDVREVVQHHEREQGRSNHKHHHDRIHALQHAAIAVDGFVVIRHGFHTIHREHVVAEHFAHVIALGDVRKQRRIRRRFSHGGFIQRRRHEHVLRHVVLHNTRHAHLAAFAHRVTNGIFVVNRDGIAHRNAQLRRELLAYEHAFIVNREGLVAHARAQRVEVAEFLRILRHVQLDALVDTIRRARSAYNFILGKHPCLRTFGVGLDAFCHGILFGIGNIGIHAYDGVVVVQLAILLVDDVVNGVLQTKTGEQKTRATCNANNRHEETALIAEEVARGNLPTERHAAP